MTLKYSEESVRFPELFKRLENTLREQMKNKRDTERNNLTALLDAQRSADIDVHGEGRLGEDAKPGVISSRTRGQRSKLGQIAEDGVIPERILEKYDCEGDLVVRYSIF